MKVKLLTNVIGGVLLSAGMVSLAQAHTIAGGQLGANEYDVDVFRTTCASLTQATIHNQGISGHIFPGPANAFVYAINLVKGSPVVATVGYTYIGNVNGPNSTGTIGGATNFVEASNPNNTLPAQWYDDGAGTTWQTVLTDSISNAHAGAAWTTQTEEPTFSTTSFAVTAPNFVGTTFETGGNNAITGIGNGEYVIVIGHEGTSVTQYDFIGHCVNTTIGRSIYTAHTGQGTWWQYDNGSGQQNGSNAFVDVTASASSTWQSIVSGGDYDQVIGQDVYNNGVFKPLSVLSSTWTDAGIKDSTCTNSYCN